MSGYFKRYLRIAPFSHALWRACEARSLKGIKFKRPILDLGCGFGEFAGVYYKSSVEMGIDSSHSDLEKATNVGKYKKLILADARYMPFKNESFKTIVSISVIEHIPKTNEVLKEANRVLAKNGLFVCTTPRKNFTKLLFFPRIFRIFGLEFFAQKYEDAINRIFKHYSLYTEKEWKSMLIKNRFKVEKIEGNIGGNVAILWDLGLFFALPSQIVKIIYGKRLVFNWKIRINLLNKLFNKFTYEQDKKVCNLLIVAKKI